MAVFDVPPAASAVFALMAEAGANADSCPAARSKPGAYNGVWRGGLEDAVKPDVGEAEPDVEEKS